MGALKSDRTENGTGLIIGHWVMLVGAVLASLSVFSAFLPIDLGVQPRFAPMSMVLHLGAGVCALGLVVSFLQARDLVIQALSHPFVLLALAIAVWSVLLAPLSENFWLSLLGDYFFGEATIRYVILGVFYATAIVLAAGRWTFLVLCTVLAAVSIVAPVIMYLWGKDFFVSLDLVGYFAFPAVVATWFLTERLQLWVRLGLTAASVLPAFAFSTNFTVIVVIGVIATPLTILTYLALRKDPDKARLIRLVGVIIVFLAPLAGVLAKWLLPEVFDVPSVLSRHLLDKVMLSGILADPWILAVGQGWGAINLTMDSFAPLAGANMWDGSWDLADRNVSHSHSIFSEALMGAGIPAVVGLLALIASPLMVVKTENLPVAVFAAVSIAVMGTLTGEFPSTVAVVALTFGLVGCRPRSERLDQRVWQTGRAVGLLMPVIAALILTETIWQYHNTSTTKIRVSDVRANGPESPYFCDLHPNSAVYADTALSQAFIKSQRPVFKSAAAGELIPIEDLWLIDAYVCSVEKRLLESQSVSLHLAMESFRTEIAHGHDMSELPVRYGVALSDWSTKLAQMLTVAPQRTDVALGFFLSHLQRGNFHTVGSLANALLKRDPDDAVSLYFLGLAQLAAGEPANRGLGMAHLRRALDAGVQRFTPIDPVVIETIKDYRAPNRS